MNNPVEQIAAFLEHVAAQVSSLETQANEAIAKQNDEAEYRRLMQQKAELLAELSATAAPLVNALPPAHKEAVAATIGNFSKSAATSLRIGSVFYMSALLYPDEHQKGQPNNLELFIKSLGRL